MHQTSLYPHLPSTVNGYRGDQAAVAVIPYTREETTAAAARDNRRYFSSIVSALQDGVTPQGETLVDASATGISPGSVLSSMAICNIGLLVSVDAVVVDDMGGRSSGSDRLVL